MTDFLLELRCEEIPARMQAKASDDLARLFTERLAEAGLTPDRITSLVTPRRLALIAHGLPAETAAVSEEYKGPRTSAPDQALEGFLRKTGLSKDQLEDRGGVWFAVVEKPGRATADVLAEAVPAVIRAFPWPKSMRWGDASVTTESLRWVRPLQGIVAILGEELVPVEVDGIRSGYATLGHRFHHPGEITIGGAHDYAEKLRACHVIVAHEERQAIIAERAAALAAERGYVLVEDKGLVAENAGLTEWPVPLLGDFDPAFLEVPPEVIQLTLRINQKYFVLRDGAGRLAPAFICTANIDAKDGGAAIVAGNGKVLAARLSDARFFWEQDRKTKLADHATKLARITFHEKLGTVADKVERVAKLARWLVEEGIIGASPSPVSGEGRGPLAQASGKGEGASAADVAPPHPGPLPGGERERLADLAEQAARLCKADLVTDMVGEFPELQGLMGGYYARAEGLPEDVADAIRDHYKPVGQGDDVPTAPVTVAVSLADKLDTLGRFFSIDEVPTGSKDPFALRRAALGVLRTIRSNELDFNVCDVIRAALYLGSDVIDEDDASSSTWRPIYALNGFFLDRLRQILRDEGSRYDLVDAVVPEGGVGFSVRSAISACYALQRFLEDEDGKNLLAGYRRAANILKKENWESTKPAMTTAASQGISQTGEEDPMVLVDDPILGDAISEFATAGQHASSYAPEPAEAALTDALAVVEPAVDAALAAEDFGAAMAALAGLRAPIDAFFDQVTVNDPDQDKRVARLDQLARIRDAMHKIADFSRIEG